MLNYAIPLPIVEIDYYLERISIKLANLFGAFYYIVLLLFVAIVFCSFILWLLLPIIEFRKKALLKKIYEQLAETHELVYSIKQQLSDSASEGTKTFSWKQED
jgi:hypothetical protein